MKYKSGKTIFYIHDSKKLRYKKVFVNGKYRYHKLCHHKNSSGKYDCNKNAWESNIFCIKHDGVNLFKKYMVNRCRGQDLCLITKKRIQLTNFCNISIYYIRSLLRTQKGKCKYCLIELFCGAGNNVLNQISIDRIDNELGHTKNNVVLSCIFCNQGRNLSSQEDWMDMINLIKHNTLPDYTKQEYNNYWYSDLYGNMKNSPKYPDDSDIDIDYIKNLPLICSYTNIIMFPSKTSYYPFQPSIDRIDNSKGYLRDNVLITCRGLNSARNDKSHDVFVDHLQKLKECV